MFGLPWFSFHVSAHLILLQLLQGFPFLFQQIKDCINLHQSRNLIYALCRWNDRLAVHVVAMIFQAITKHTEVSTLSALKELPTLVWIILFFSYPIMWYEAEFVETAMFWIIINWRQDAVGTDLCASFLQTVECWGILSWNTAGACTTLQLKDGLFCTSRIMWMMLQP